MKKILSVILSLMLVFAGMAPAAMADNTLSNDATLLDISFDNHSVVNGEFDPSDTSYTVQQPYRFSTDGNYYKDAPVTVIKSDKNATVGEITRVNNENNTQQTITIPVTAADGVTKKTYTLTVTKVGRNQYSNGGFEDEALGSSWAMSATSTDAMEKSSEYAYSGSSSLKYTGKASTSYPYQSVSLPKDSDMTFFSHLAVKSTLTMRAHNRYTSADSHYYVDAEGKKFTDSDGNDLTCNSAPTTPSYLNGVLTEADENGWQRSMRISKGLVTLQESASSGGANGSIPAYFDEFYVGPLVIGSVNVTSDGEGYVRCGEAATINFEAELLNQYGNKGGLANETVTWHLINAPEEVSIDEATGVVTVPETLSEAGEFYVEARVVPTFNQGITSSWSIHCQSWMGGRAKVTVLPANAVAQLSDIEVNGGSVYGFNSATTSYDIYVPYVYAANNFNNFAMPTVSATAVDPEGNVEIIYPNAVADNEKIYIDVTDASGVLKTRYTLTIKTVGGNLFPDGGFETEAISKYTKSLNNGSFSTLEILDNTVGGAGNKVLHGQSGTDTNAFNSSIFYGSTTSADTDVYMEKGKTYVNGFMAKLYNYDEGDETSFDADVTSPNPNSVPKYSSYRVKFAGAYYNQANGELVANDNSSITLTEDWGKYMALAKFTQDITVNGETTLLDKIRVGVDVGHHSNKVTEYLYDELYLGELVIANMEVKDAENNTAKTITVPATGATETVNLTASIKNQYGNTVGLADETFAWRELVDYAGVSVDNGVVTVADNAAPGKVVIEATVTPSYTGAAQSAVSKRYTLTILPRDGFVTVGNTHTVTFTNKTGVALNLSFISAIYEGTALKSVISTNDISASDGETISRSHDMAVGAGQTIKHFLWNKTTLTPYIAQ